MLDRETEISDRLTKLQGKETTRRTYRGLWQQKIMESVVVGVVGVVAVELTPRRWKIYFAARNKHQSNDAYLWSKLVQNITLD